MIEPALQSVEAEGSAAGASHDYWRRMNGSAYQQIVAGREGSGQHAYQMQEQILTELVSTEQARLGRPLELLEFGCGFGRHAWYLSALEDVRYHGYDFSEEMVSPLRGLSPPAMAPIEEHLFVGTSVRAAVGDRRFDLIFTVSVLIHNAPEHVRALIDGMAERLQPGGALVFVENQLVPFSVFENNWHEGCWLHRFLDSVGDGWDLHVGHGLIGTHDVYLLRRNGEGGRRLFLMGQPGALLRDAQPTTEAELDRLGIPKAKAWAASAEGAIRRRVDTDVRAVEAAELVRAERAQLERQRSFLTLAQSLATLRDARALRSRQVVARDSAPKALATVAKTIEFDAPLDVHWAQQDARFSRVLHVVHQEWHGIRAAAGYLPGHKLAIPAERRFEPDEMRRAMDLCDGAMARAIVFHGYSDNADDLLQLLRGSSDSSLQILAIWHGSTAQFHHEFEQDCLGRLCELKSLGAITRLGSVKPDLHLLADAIEPELVLNLPPRVAAAESVRPTGLLGAGLIPVPVDWRKNFYTAYYAACGVRRLRTLYVTTKFKERPEFQRRSRVVRLPQLDRWNLLQRIRETDVILNTTLSECQPMTALEGLALGVPCLTGPLSLGDLDRHPYQRRVQVAGVDSLGEVRRAIEAILDQSESAPRELAEEMKDYLNLHVTEASRRLGEFLGL